jgi:hypothetical protein
MRTNYIKAIVIATITILLSCKKEVKDTSTTGPYIVAVTPIASTAVADYLINTESLETGMVTTRGNGLEQDGTYRYYVTHKNKFFSMLYGQGNPGAVTTYNLQNNRLTRISNFMTETVQAFAPVKDDIVLIKIPRAINAKGQTQANWYRVNADNMLIVAEGTLDAMAPSNNKEIAHFSWIKQVGDKVYAPYFSIKSSNFWTDYPDQAWIAVYSYPDMKLEKVITDDRTSFIGRYFVDGLGVVENGDVYCFSSSVAQGDNKDTPDDPKDMKLNSTKPSAITKIKAGTTEFDLSYYFNFETASNDYVITNWLYVGNNNFVAQIQPKKTKGAYVAGKELAIVNVVDKTVKKVTGLPTTAEIKTVTGNNYTAIDGTAHFGVNLTSGVGYIYKIDATTATATRGLKVEGGTITAIQHLD